MYWKHSDYELTYQIANTCFTCDEAVRVLNVLKKDRELSIKITYSENHRAKSKLIGAKSCLGSNDPQIDKEQAKATLLELEARNETTKNALIAAKHEIQTIELLLKYYKKHCLLKEENFQQIQIVECFYNHFWNVYLNLLSVGYIPVDLIESIYSHPEHKILFQAISELKTKIQNYSQYVTKREILDIITGKYVNIDKNNLVAYVEIPKESNLEFKGVGDGAELFRSHETSKGKFIQNP